MWPVNKNGEIVLTGGSGDSNVVGYMDGGLLPLAGGGLLVSTIPTPAPAVPLGLDWLKDTLNGIDLYAGGFILRPTIYFDPEAKNSLGYGTINHPYFTQEQLEAVCKGDMSGEVLGFKRGTTLKVTGAGLTLQVNGSAGKPFTICPYGDAKELPIISGGVVETNWQLVDAASNIWSIPMPAIETPCFQSGVRLDRKAYVTNAVSSLTTPGTQTYQAGVAYIRPFDGVDPRSGVVEISKAETLMRVFCTNVAVTGYIRVCGLKFTMGYQSGAQIGAPDVTNITSVADLMFTGCSATNIGQDGDVVTGSGDAFIVYGATTTKRATGVVVQGCYASDITNNAVEFSNTSGAKVLKNISYNCSGNSIVELWSDNDNCVVQYNLGELSRARYSVQYAMGGVWFANMKTVNNVASGDTTNTLNFNNSASFNLIIAPQSRGFACGGGTGHSFQNNTVILDDDRCNGLSYESASYWFTDGNAATGFCNISNNLFYTKSSVNTRYQSPAEIRSGMGAAKSNPVGNNNIYCPNQGGNYAWVAGNKKDYTFTTWKTALTTAGAALDQNSLLYAPETSAPLKRAQLGFNEVTNRPLKSKAVGLTTLKVGTRYIDGQPYRPATATIGALEGY